MCASKESMLRVLNLAAFYTHVVMLIDRMKQSFAEMNSSLYLIGNVFSRSE